jgi:NADPH:quinone reductase-like Zn-dependent oxidoreductase
MISVGSEVTSLTARDWMIGNHNDSVEEAPDAPPGIATNHASREFEVLPAGKLMRIPDALDINQADGFGIGAQTVLQHAAPAATAAGPTSS